MGRILFVDDETDFRTGLTTLLESAGYAVDAAADGLEAEAFLNKKEYDFIVTDIVMPKKEGIELIFELKKRQIKSKIIAISGGGKANSKEYLHWAEALQVDSTLSKPFSFAELLETLHRLSAAN